MTRMSCEQSIPWTTQLGGGLASVLIRVWMSTLEYRAAYYDRRVDPASKEGDSRIYVFWHDSILLPLYLRGGCDMTILLSRHRDADILADLARRSGFGCVRGSTFRGAAPAIRELLKHGRRTHLAITPDGPRGPRRKLAHGAIYLASKLDMPIVAIGVGYDRPWRAPTWDRFAVPRPFRRARAIVSPEMQIPRNLSRPALENCRVRLEALLNRLSEEAEAWAVSGARQTAEELVGRSKRHQLAA